MNSYEVDVHNLLVGGVEHLVYFSRNIRNVITPTDFHSIIFQRGRYNNHQPDKQILKEFGLIPTQPLLTMINHH
jgi:hypothetical protein